MTEEEAQEMTPVLVNGSPKLPRIPMPAALDHESFDITLHRKDSEGFGFVILTSKSKPPLGGERQVFQLEIFIISFTFNHMTAASHVSVYSPVFR